MANNPTMVMAMNLMIKTDINLQAVTLLLAHAAMVELGMAQGHRMVLAVDNIPVEVVVAQYMVAIKVEEVTAISHIEAQVASIIGIDYQEKVKSLRLSFHEYACIQ